MLNEKEIYKICREFGIESVDAGVHQILDEEDEIVNEFTVDLIWIAQIRSYFKRTTTVAVAHFDKVPKALVLFPPIREPLNKDFGGSMTLKAIELPNWIDPVAQVLMNFNLVPRHIGTAFGESANKHFSLETISVGFTSRLQYYRGIIDDVQTQALWDGILATIQRYVSLSADEELAEFIKLQ